MGASRSPEAGSGLAPLGGGFGGILWGSAGITVPWEVYLQYGDLQLLRDHYAAMAAYMHYLTTTIDPATGLIGDAQLGDWLGPQNQQLGQAFLATAYHVYDFDVMRKTARLIGRGPDATRYEARYQERKAFLNKTFVNADHKALGLVGQGEINVGGRAGEFKVADTQTAYAVGLALGAFSDDNIPYMQKNLAAAVERENADDKGVMRPKYSLMTGFIGTAWISKSLSDAGRADLSYRLLQNNQYPSWLYAVDQGATTIWERLNGYTVENGFGGNNNMNSFNHYSFGAVGQWMLANSLGIQRGEPGLQSFILRPEPDPTGQMSWAKGHYESEYGTINSEWRVDAGKLTYTATVPPNTNATLYLPAGSPQNILEGGRAIADASGVAFVGYEQGRASYRLRSGSYHFTVAP
jgi:alpha-L-rhamnosidase